MQTLFRCPKEDDRLVMRKRCIERQEINKGQSKFPFDTQLYPDCTPKCIQGRIVRKELGIKIKAKDRCKEPECTAPAVCKGRCNKCDQRKRYKERKAMKGYDSTKRTPSKEPSNMELADRRTEAGQTDSCALFLRKPDIPIHEGVYETIREFEDV